MFSDKELKDINELRSRLQDMHISDSEQWLKNLIDDDCTMWRYILAKSLEDSPMDASEEMFRKSVEWRKQIGIMDQLPREWRFQDESGRKYLSARARFGDLCFYGGVIEKPTISGGPVLIEQLWKIDLVGLYNDEYAFQCTSMSYIMYLEDAWKRVLAAGNKVRGVIVIDVAQCGLGMLNYISVVKTISSAGVLHYPEITEQVNIVNAGWVLSILWGAIKPFLPSRTQSKLRIISGHEVSELANNMVDGLTSLPDFLGGLADERMTGICPGYSVDEAYEIVLNEIIEAQDSNENIYPDSEAFLIAAQAHYRLKKSDDESSKRKVEEIDRCLAQI